MGEAAQVAEGLHISLCLVKLPLFLQSLIRHVGFLFESMSAVLPMMIFQWQKIVRYSSQYSTSKGAGSVWLGLFHLVMLLVEVVMHLLR
jgi:hypothetical protein